MNKPSPSEQTKILIVDDEASILDNLAPFLSRAGFIVEQAEDGIVALEKVESFAPDIVILDVIMPKMDGRQVLRELRDNEQWVPVILLTQVGDATERAMALTEGADDYLNKPYDPHELVARVNSILRRMRQGGASLISGDVLKAGALMFDRKSRIVTLAGVKLNLTPKANHLLEYFMLHPNEALNRDRLLNAVWGWEFITGSRSVDARVVELRKAMQIDQEIEYIETVAGDGYRFALSVSASRQP